MARCPRRLPGQGLQTLASKLCQCASRRADNRKEKRLTSTVTKSG